MPGLTSVLLELSFRSRDYAIYRAPDLACFCGLYVFNSTLTIDFEAGDFSESLLDFPQSHDFYLIIDLAHCLNLMIWTDWPRL
jgi:hypothetical protein